MKRILSSWSWVALGTVAVVSLWAADGCPLAAQGQISTAAGTTSSGGGGGGGSATASAPSTASSGGSSSAGASSTGGGGTASGSYTGGGVSSAPSGGSAGRSGATGGSGYAAPRGDAPHTPGPGGRNGRNPNGHTPVGNAVPRGSVPSNTRPGTIVVVPGSYYGGYYDPWWFGLGYIGMYSGYYDPWYGGYPSYSQSSSYTPYTEEGALKLKIKPREAEVYVDGYFVGIVDDFDGVFQKLHIETGPHRIEVRAPGYESLVIEVRIAADETTTYHGELKRIP